MYNNNMVRGLTRINADYFLKLKSALIRVNPRATFLPLFLFLLAANLHAQSAAQEMDILLATNAISYAQAARFVLDASEVLTTRSQEEAFNFAMEKGWFPKKATAQGEIKLSEVSKLFMHAFDFKGGIMFSITKAPLYAYRELAYRGIVVGRTAPAMQVSGDYLILMIGRVLAEFERAAALAQERERKRLEAEARAAERAAMARRQALAAEITAILEEHHVSNTTAEATSAGVMITLSNIQFEADSAVLPAYERNKLQEIASILVSVPARNILIVGHTADTGNRAGEQRVSRDRAQSVADYLISLGARNRNEITVNGYGAERPIASNATAEGMAANRRVEITILEQN